MSRVHRCELHPSLPSYVLLNFSLSWFSLQEAVAKNIEIEDLKVMQISVAIEISIH